jgi:hypothetical protein
LWTLLRLRALLELRALLDLRALGRSASTAARPLLASTAAFGRCLLPVTRFAPLSGRSLDVGGRLLGVDAAAAFGPWPLRP